MKRILSLFTVMLFFGVLATTNIVTIHAQPVAGTQCDDPTQFVTVEAQEGTKFNQNTINVDPDTCVQITIKNTDKVIPHDFTVEGTSGVMEEVYIPVNGGVTDSFNVMTPNLNVTYAYYCSVVGHRGQGMEGKFIVGEGSPSNEDDSPGFGFWISFTGFLTLVAIYSKVRKH